jgi:hypothetical protein
VQPIGQDVARDTRKHFPTDSFRSAIYGAPDGPPDARTIKGFATLRRAALLAHPEVRAALDMTNPRR